MGRKSLPGERTLNPKRKQELARAAMPFFMEKGLQEVTMDDAAAYLQKSKATIYKYFPSRENLIQEGLAVKLAQLKSFVPILQEPGKDYLERYNQAMAQFLADAGDISNIFLKDLKAVFPTLWQQVETFRKFAQMVLHQFYLEGIAEGKLKKIHPALLVQMDRFVFEELTDGEFLSNNNLSLKEAFAQYLEIKFFGIVKPG